MRFFQRVIIQAAIILMSALLSAQLFAEPISRSNSKKEPRKQTLTFGDELVEGSTQKPDLFYLFQKKNFNYKRLIRLRENFIPEAKRATEEIQVGRGNN
jgi:hypothetical protein